MLTGLLFIIILICVAFLWNEGLWGNAISLVNVTIAALIATNYFEPLAGFLEGMGNAMASFTYFWDFLSIWMIFVVAMVIMRTTTDFLTKTKVKFKAPVEHAGRAIVALLVGWVMMSFTCMTLHLAPLAERPIGGSFHNATKADGGLIIDKNLPNHFAGILAPDRFWLAVVQKRSGAKDDGYSTGALARWWGQRTFDPKSRFIFKYGARRRALEEYNKEKGAMRVDFRGTN